MESVRGGRRTTEYSRTHRLKSVSESSTNDSGYSSEVFTSPEFSRGSWNLDVPSDSSIKGCLAFDGPATRTRLASTPHSSTNKSKDFVFPSPELGGIKNPILSNDSAVDVVAPSDTDESEIEIISRKVGDNTLNIIRGQKQTASSRGRTKCSSSKAVVSGVPLVKASIRTNKPQNIVLKILKEAEYLMYEVLKHLSPQDLICVSQVNRQLRNIIFGHKILSSRRLLFITKTRKECERIGKENLKLKRLNEAVGVSCVKLSPRKQLGEIQNISVSNDRKAPEGIVRCPPKALSDRFIEEGKKLPEGEELQKCVKCKAPAQVHKSVFRAVCSSESCGYDYCTRCCLPSHRKVQECSVLKPRARNGAGMFSKKCKKNLRRL